MVCSYQNKGQTGSIFFMYIVTSASLLVTSALLLVTRTLLVTSASRNKSLVSMRMFSEKMLLEAMHLFLLASCYY